MGITSEVKHRPSCRYAYFYLTLLLFSCRDAEGIHGVYDEKIS